MRNYMLREYDVDTIPTNKHPVATGISMFFTLLGVIGFAILVFAAGCSSPPDNCAEVDKCDNGDDVDGSVPDQPDGNSSNCATTGTCPDAGTNPDAPSTATCAANAWMESPEMFDCYNPGTNQGSLCDPLLIEAAGGCQVRCVESFWATPDQIVAHPTEHYFDYINVESEITIRCTQRAQ